MSLQPFKKNLQVSATPKVGSLKPFTPVNRAPIPKPDIRQSDVYRNAVARSQQAQTEAQKAASFGGMTKNFIKEIPKAALNVAVGTPIKFGASVAEIPEIVARGKATQRTYNVPGLTPFKSYQSDFDNLSRDVIEGRKGLRSAAWGLAQVPLAGLETAGILKGAGKGIKAFQKAPTIAQGLKSAIPEIVDPFIPVKGGKTSSKTALRNTETTPSRISQTGDQAATGEFSGVSSYTPITTPIRKNVNDTQTLANKASEIINPVKPKAKERGFIETVRNSPEVSADIANKVEGTYNVKHNPAQLEKAQRLIFENPLEAERIASAGNSDESVFMANELVKHYDTIAQQSKRAGNSADFEVAMNKAVDIAQKNAANLTEAGRTVQAASTINRLSPEGIIAYVNKAVKDVGGDIRLSNEKYYQIVRQAEEVKNILDPKQKALATFDLIDSIYSDIPKSMQNKVSEALNLPRAIMATADLSAPLRQGIFSAARNPKMFSKNFGSMFKYAFSENAYRNLKADIITSPNYNLYVKYKLPLTDISQQLTGREEQFLSSWAEKIPGFGKIAKGSNRAYSGFLNKMRMDLFDDFIKTGKEVGINDPKYLESAADFVGAATGRGTLYKTIEPHAALLNSIFFSPRLMASRFNLINPKYYIGLHPAVRKEALKTLAAFVGTGASILGLSKLAGAEVGTDPRSADFGKIKIGNTRFDTWGGFQQYAVLISRLLSGEMVSSTTGKEFSLTDGGYNATTYATILNRFFQSKENPLASFVTGIATGKSGLDDFNLPAEVIDRFIPMLAQDAFDLYREYGPQGLLMAVPGAFGIGSQTYSDQIPMFTETATGNVGIKYRQQPSLGETIWNGATGTEVSNVPQQYWKALAEERLAEQKRQIELDKAKSLVLVSGEPQQVGDTYVYLDKGVVKTRKQGKEKRLPLKEQLLYQELQKRSANTKPYYGN